MNGGEQLHAFVDGEMDRAATVEFAAKIASSPALAREVARIRADKALLAKAYGGIADQPIPDRLRAPFRRQSRTRRATQWGAGIGLAAAFSLMLWILPPKTGGDVLVTEALRARDGGIHAEQRVDAAALQSADARDALLAGVLSVPVKVPDLGNAGYQLANITLFKQSAQVSYRDAAGRLFTLYLRHPLGPDRFDMRSQGKTEICVWENAELAVAMVGEMGAKEMLKLAAATYADLNL